MEDHTCEIVEDSQCHQCKYEIESDGIDTLNGTFGELAAGYDFDKGEEDISAIEHRNRQEVHDGQNDADEGRKTPECRPIPCGGEKTADGTERPYAFGTFAGEDKLQLIDITAHLFPTITDAGR